MRGTTTFGFARSPEDLPDNNRHLHHPAHDHRESAIDATLQSHDQINDALADDLEHRPMYDRNKAHHFAEEHP